MRYREATAGDAAAIAGLHADRWRRHYRGAYLDSFLDGEVVTDRMAEWAGRLTRAGPFPGGGHAFSCRYAWPDLSALAAHT